MKAGSFTVAMYLRISEEDKERGKNSKRESDSITNQRNLLIDFIGRMPELKKAEVIEFFDDGWSGRNFERPAVKEMLGKVKRGEIHCIVVKDISRFGRDYLTVGNYLSHVFPYLGVRFIAVNDGFDSSRQRDVDSLETSLKTLVYDFYSRDISVKVRTMLRLKAQKGEFLSAYAPFGYRKDPDDNHRLLIDTEAAKVVHRIFKLATEGLSTTEIARLLNREQVPTPMAYKKAAGCSRKPWKCVGEKNFWTHDGVIKILRDERYTGKAIFGRRRQAEIGNPHTVKVNRGDWITLEQAHEGIVTQEEFVSAQAQLRKPTERSPRQTGKGGPFPRKIRCAVCGRAMMRIKTRQSYYICRTSWEKDDFSCTLQRMSEKDLLEIVLIRLCMEIILMEDASHIREKMDCLKKSEAEALQKELSGLKESQNVLEQYRQILYEKFVFGEMDKAAYIAEKKVVEKESDSIAARIQTLWSEAGKVNARIKPETNLESDLRKYEDMKETAIKMIPEIVKEIVVYPGRKIHIVWNYCEDNGNS